MQSSDKDNSAGINKPSKIIRRKVLFTHISKIFKNPMASDAAFLALSQYISAILGFVKTVIAARILGPANYGVVAMIVAFPTLLWSFASIKSVSVTTKYAVEFHESGQENELKGICKLGFILDIVVSVIALLIAVVTCVWAASSIIKMPETAWLIVMYAVSFPFLSMNGTSLTILYTWRRFRLLAVLQIIEPCIEILIVSILLVAGYGVSGMVVALASSQIVISSIYLVIATCIFKRRGLGYWWKGTVKSVSYLRRELFAFLGWNYWVVTLSGLVIQVPILLLGALRGSEDAGFLRLAITIITIISYLESSLGRVVYPNLVADKNDYDFNRFKRTLSRWTLYGGLPVSLLIIAAIPIIPHAIPLFFGSEYSSMISGTQVMLVGAAIASLFFWLNPAYYAYGKFSIWGISFTIYVSIVLALSWPIIYRWGFFGLTSAMTLGKVAFIGTMVYTIRWVMGKE